MPAREFARGEVLEIRRRGLGGESAPSIARDYPGVGVETIRRILRGETYRNVGVLVEAGRVEAPPDAAIAEAAARSHAHVLEMLREASEDAEAAEPTEHPLDTMRRVREGGQTGDA